MDNASGKLQESSALRAPISLSPHFTLAEFVATQHRGIDNTPTAPAIANLKYTAMQMEAVRLLLGCPIIITSGYRCEELNKAVGGQPNSQHLWGQAVDFIAPSYGPPMTIASRLKDSGIHFDQCIVEFDRWVHLSFVPNNPRCQLLRIDATGTRPLFG